MESEQMPRELKRLAEWKCEDIVFCLAASGDATKLWLGSSDSRVYEFDISSEKPERRKFDGEGHSSYVTGMARTGNNLVTCSYDKRLIWWDIESRQLLRAIEAHDKWIRRVITTPDGSRVITVADDMRCRVWDAESAELIAGFSDHAEMTPHNYPSMLYAVAISADGSHIATGDRTGHVAIWDAATFEKVSELEAPVMYTWDPTKRRHSIGGIRSLSFSPDGSKLAIGGMGQVGNIDHLQGPSRLEVFDIESGDRLLEIEDEKKKGLIEQIAWSADWIMTAGGAHNGFISVYDSKTGEQLNTADHSGHGHAFVHDDQFEIVFVAAHQRVSRWSYVAKES
jgi:WD40 repeat protein